MVRYGPKVYSGTVSELSVLARHISLRQHRKSGTTQHIVRWDETTRGTYSTKDAQTADRVCCYCRYVCHPLLIWFVLRGPLSHTSRPLFPSMSKIALGLGSVHVCSVVRLRLCSSVSPMAN